ncbi:MAG: rhombosortase [Pseudomonadota bacterium]
MIKLARKHVLMMSLVGVCMVLALCSQASVEWLYYTRSGIAAGQWWQLWTGHLSHSTLYHCVVNVGVVLVLYYFFIEHFDRWHWGLTLCVLMPLSSLLYYQLNPQFDVYTGFSGMVQAWLSLLLVRSIRESMGINLLILGLQWGRIVMEQLPGYDVDYMKDVINASVAVDAHLYGAALGVLCGLFCLWMDANKQTGSETAE